MNGGGSAGGKSVSIDPVEIELVSTPHRLKW